ncbi:MAG: UrcA family protein [Pseudomonadota bacterium]
MYSTIKTCVAAGALAVLASPVAAEKVSIAVPYGDLNLSDDRGTAALENRLESAIRKVCGRDAFRSVDYMIKVRKCERNLRRKATKMVAEIATGRVMFAGELEIAYRG